MTKLLPVEKDGEIVGYYFRCPGCRYGHVAHINPHKNNINARWNFNGNVGKPTFSPSILNRVKFDSRYEQNKPDEVCHIFVTDGQIQFLSDCTHSLAGKIVDIPDLEEST
jgi:hypothetical protein